MNRAYCTLAIKAVADAAGARRFEGIASTPTTDRMGDIVEPRGARYQLPLALLWQHDPMDPIGWIRSVTVDSSGIRVQGEVADVPHDGPLRTRLTDAWEALRCGLVRGLSIGFQPVPGTAERMKNGGMRFKEWTWHELSAVSIPANAEANITNIKAADAAQMRTAGLIRVVRSAPPKTNGSGVRLINRRELL